MRTSHLYPLLLVASACAEAGTQSGAPGGPSHNVTQGGAKDIALFRRQVAAGEVPKPEVLDEVGFFAEHALDLPPASCGADLCLHPFLAVAPTFDHGNWTMAYVALNSPIAPSELPRGPAHVALVIEWDGRAPAIGEAALEGLDALRASLRAEDRLTLILYGAEARLLARAEPPDAPSWSALAAQLYYYGDHGGAALYDGLATAARVFADTPGFDGAERVVLVTSGAADVGVVDPSRLVSLGEGLARQQIGLSVIGAAPSEVAFDRRIAAALGEIGAGTFAFAEGPADLVRLLRQEGETSLVPLATELVVEIQAAPGYRVGRTYGAPRAKVGGRVARLESPALFLGHRTGAQDLSMGRRGGGGGLFVELIADPAEGARVGAGQPAFTISASWVQARDGRRSWRGVVANPMAPGQNPPPTWPYFSDAGRGKAFMMLNMYLALRAAVDFYDGGDCPRAKGLIDLVDPMVELWQAQERDPDIAADRQLMGLVRANVDKACVAERPQHPRHFSGGCFGL